MYKKILVPVDGSPTSNKAVEAAAQLACDSGGTVLLLHVIEELSYLIGYDPYGSISADLPGILRDTGKQVLGESSALAGARGASVETRLIDTVGERLSQVVADAATEWGADLIVVGTHGRRGVGRLLMGSGAEQIIRYAPVPTLVIRAADDHESERKILEAGTAAPI
ncbi:MAG: universal stress protein [Pseudomonadota bacterium]